METLSEAASSRTTPSSPDTLPKWEIPATDIVLFLCLGLTASFGLSQLFASLYISWSGEEYSSTSLAHAISAGLGLQLGGIAAWAALRKLAPSPPLGLAEPASKAALVGAIGFLAAYGGLIPLTFGWKALLDASGIEYAFQDPVLMIKQGGTITEMALMSFLIVVGAPVSEELIYRGVFYRYLHGRLPETLAILLPAAFWALIHQNLYSFVPLLFLGFCLSYVYRRTGNLFASIVLHSIFNLINLVLLLFGVGE